MYYDNAPVVLVSGGKGGVGKSSVSAGIVKALAHNGLHVGLLDADLTGPSQSVLFGGQMSASGDSLVPMHSGNVSVCSLGYLSESPSALVWSEDAMRSLFARFLFETAWGDIDLMVVDLPPTSGAVTRLLMERIERAGTVFVTTASDLAIADCRRDITFHRKLENNPLGIIHNMAYIKCVDCQHFQPIGTDESLNSLADEVGLSILAKLPYDDRIACGAHLDDTAVFIAEQLGVIHDK